jgi:hypothetical protein
MSDILPLRRFGRLTPFSWKPGDATTGAHFDPVAGAGEPRSDRQPARIVGLDYAQGRSRTAIRAVKIGEYR